MNALKLFNLHYIYITLQIKSITKRFIYLDETHRNQIGHVTFICIARN